MSPAQFTALSGIPTGAQVGPREFDAVVASSGGDFTSIVDAFASGARTVFVRPGTYNELSNIVVPAGGCLVGACPGAVAVVMGPGARVVLDGSGRLTTAGTLSITSGSTTVTGVGTSFTTLQAGDYIVLGDAFYSIASVTDDLALELTAAYRGTAISGQATQGQSMLVAAGIENMNFVAPGVTAIELTQCYRCFFRAVSVQFSGSAVAPAWRVVDSGSIVLQTCATDNNNGVGLAIQGSSSRSSSIFLLAVVVRNNDGAGIQLNNTDNAVLDSCILYQNANNGISVLGTSSRIHLLDSFSSYNDQKGMDVSASANAVVLGNCTLTFNGSDGLDFNGSDSNLVEGCLVANNGGAGVNGGSNGVVDGCQVRDNAGVGIDMQAASNDTAVTSCIVDGNGGDGIRAAGQSTITANRVRNNGGRGIDVMNAADDGSLTANLVSGNTGDGIRIQNTAARWVVTGNNTRLNGGTNFNDLSATTVVGVNVTA
jgi:parallel beta-helix repeat protein